jgi:phosphoribosylformimino-5-aminoimidazole carboxamide ribotide isomerase
VERILSAVKMPVQLGGGIRDRATIEAWLGKGIARVIIGTAAVREPALVREAARANPGRVAVGLDARNGKVAVEGWAETSELFVFDIARRFEDAGVAAIILIASGGLASLDDVHALLEPRAQKLQGAIVGRALYDGRLDAAAALRLLRGARATA